MSAPLTFLPPASEGPPQTPESPPPASEPQDHPLQGQAAQRVVLDLLASAAVPAAEEAAAKTVREVAGPAPVPDYRDLPGFMVDGLGNQLAKAADEIARQRSGLARVRQEFLLFQEDPTQERLKPVMQALHELLQPAVPGPDAMRLLRGAFIACLNAQGVLDRQSAAERDRVLREQEAEKAAARQEAVDIAEARRIQTLLGKLPAAQG